ncbi:hemoglobin-like flavoprotein [Caulobacter ginsengisoli]|uniref:Hemoglobin-like flavoprotein n=1 Tax=Caulobacter ginsengisoli TaxID=400775 RepID=A0ABU0IWG9_9CAUL|nr:globin [Caulobacter ginsengisoli]MDQ0466356.1 hemoglobin-like flavoprotein [Caulobacter ginsengisoli]
MGYSYAAGVEASLEAVAERDIDLTGRVYELMFAAFPDTQAYFWRDQDGAIKGEMLARVFEAILDFIGERRYADHMLRTEMVTHEGYDVPREVFVTFFGFVARATREALGQAWTGEMDAAWPGMLADIQSYAGAAPRNDVAFPDFARFKPGGIAVTR